MTTSALGSPGSVTIRPRSGPSPVTTRIRCGSITASDGSMATAMATGSARSNPSSRDVSVAKTWSRRLMSMA